MGKNNAFLMQIAAGTEIRCQEARMVGRQLAIDIACICLGELGFSDWGKFRDLYEKTEYEYACIVTNEADEERKNRDKVGAIWVSKDKLDKALEAAVGSEFFCKFDERYASTGAILKKGDGGNG